MADGDGTKPLTAQQEKFCELLATGMSQTEAYKGAGYKPKDDNSAKANASRLLTNDNVTLRVQQLRLIATQRTEITLEWLQNEAKAVFNDAKTNGKFAAAVSALKELGILTGLRVEKRDNTNRNVNDVSDFTREELYAIARGSSQGAVAPGSGTGRAH